MNLDLKGEKQSYMRPVFRRRFVREETVEVIVPDAQPDILRILDTDGTPFLRGKDAQPGKVTVTGVSELTVMYVPETGGGVKHVNVSVPFAAESEGADITPDCLITACVTLSQCDARTVNPRKLVVRAEVTVEACLYAPESVYNSSPREQEALYFRTASRPLRLASAVNEKTFIFTDEIHLPSEAPAVGEVLRCTSVLVPESAKPVGSKAVVKGTAETTLLYESKEGTLCRECFSSPFSQIVETDSVGEADDVDVQLMLTGSYVNRNYMEDGQGEALTLEFHAVAQCVAYSDMDLGGVTDVYSTKSQVTPQTVRREFLCRGVPETDEKTVEFSIPISGKAAKVHSTTLRCGSAYLQESGDGLMYTAMLTCTAVYSDADGQVMSASRRSEFQYPLGPDATELNVSVRQSGQASAVCADGTVEVRITLELTLTGERCETVEYMESLELDEDKAVDLSKYPSIVVIRAGQATDMWELAKRHMSTVELIRELNELEGDPEPGSVLLIPRCG